MKIGYGLIPVLVFFLFYNTSCMIPEREGEEQKNSGDEFDIEVGAEARAEFSRQEEIVRKIREDINSLIHTDLELCRNVVDAIIDWEKGEAKAKVFIEDYAKKYGFSVDDDYVRNEIIKFAKHVRGLAFDVDDDDDVLNQRSGFWEQWVYGFLRQYFGGSSD